MRSEERKKSLGEVFTEEDELNQICLDEIPEEEWVSDSLDDCFLDPTCGNGEILIRIKDRLLQHGHSEKNTLSRIFGVDIMEDNIQECKQRLDPDNKYPEIVNQNIVCADALTYHYRFDGSSPREEENFFEF